MISRYITYPVVTDARDLMTRAFNFMKLKIPNWQPAEPNLDVWIIEAAADQGADIASLTSQVPTTIFRFGGNSLFRFPPIDATAATVTSTWYFNDTVDHLIRAGTQLGIRDNNGNLVPFKVLVDYEHAGGTSNTPAGAVVLIAVTPGSEATDIGFSGDNAELLDTISWVNYVNITAATSGGVDAETDQEYLDRIAVKLQTITPTPILAPDFSILARDVPGVQRAVTLDGYNPSGDTFGNEKMVTVFALDDLGVPVGAGVKTAISDYLEGLRELNFVVNTADPTMHEIDYTVHAQRQAGYTQIDVASRIVTAIKSFSDPRLWGVGPSDNPNDPVTWNNTNTIRYLDLAARVGNVSGVDHITLLTLGLHGGAQAAADLTMTGRVPVPFTTDADITVVVS